MTSRYFALNHTKLGLDTEATTSDENGQAAPAKAASSAASSERLSLPEHTRSQVLQLVQRLFVVPRATVSPRLVLISSIGEGHGENVAAWAAEVLASRNCGTVCLVDANALSPKMQAVFSVPGEVGFTDYLAKDPANLENPRSFTHNIPGSNLWVMPPGTRSPGQQAITSELLVAAAVGLRSNFDYVLINAPLSAKHALSSALAPFTDGVVLVIAAGETRREVVMQVKSELESSQARILGAVLNNRKFSVPNFLYKRLF